DRTADLHLLHGSSPAALDYARRTRLRCRRLSAVPLSAPVDGRKRQADKLVARDGKYCLSAPNRGRALLRIRRVAATRAICAACVEPLSLRPALRPYEAARERVCGGRIALIVRSRHRHDVLLQAAVRARPSVSTGVSGLLRHDQLSLCSVVAHGKERPD